MASCTDIPTLTTTILDVSTLTSTSLTTLTTTLPPTTSTLTSTTCLTSSNSTCIASTTVTTLTTIPGETDTLTSTISVPFTTTSTTTSTLFSHSCTDGSTTSSSPPTQPPPSSPPNTPDSTTNTSSTITTQSTLADGSTIIVTTTEVVPVTASNTLVPSTQGSDTSGSSSSSSDNHLGPIIGGTVGGIAGLAAIILIVWFVLKRRRRWDDIFDHDEAIGGVGMTGMTGNHTRFSLSADLDGGEPKPYQYGLVGLPGSTPVPNSPPTHASQIGSDTTSASSVYGGMASDPSQHFNRSNSLSPLNMPGGVVATGLQLHTPTTMSASRPSSSGSTQPLNQGPYPQPSAYPSQMQQYYQQPQQQPPPQRGPSAHSASPSLNQPPLQPVTGWMMNTGLPQNQTQNAPIRQSFDEFSPRAGSPVSYQEPRRLTVANHRDSVASPVDEFGPRTSMSSLPTTSAAAVEALPQRDGKGRIRASVSGNNVIVHNDGGRIDATPQAGPARQRTPGPEAAPPAYTE